VNYLFFLDTKAQGPLAYPSRIENTFCELARQLKTQQGASPVSHAPPCAPPCVAPPRSIDKLSHVLRSNPGLPVAASLISSSSSPLRAACSTRSYQYSPTTCSCTQASCMPLLAPPCPPPTLHPMRAAWCTPMLFHTQRRREPRGLSLHGTRASGSPPVYRAVSLQPYSDPSAVLRREEERVGAYTDVRAAALLPPARARARSS
jgi:hypothetical protein